MRKIYFLLLILVFAGSGSMAQSGRKSRHLRPSIYQNRIVMYISGKQRYYYDLSSEKRSLITLRGPGKLRVITRGMFRTETADQLGYTILYTIDGAQQQKFTVTDAERSNTTVCADRKLGNPANSKDLNLDLGRGDHSIEFRLQAGQPPVAARYIFVPSKVKKQDWISFSPLRPSEPVDLITREDEITYYRFSKEKPLKVEVNGRTEVRVLSRIENHYQMRGRIHYRVQVLENNKVINTYQLSSVRSEVTVYKDNNELIPGKGCEFVIDVPKGRHAYEIIPLDEDKSTLLGRMLLPKKDVKLEQ